MLLLRSQSPYSGGMDCGYNFNIIQVTTNTIMGLHKSDALSAIKWNINIQNVRNESNTNV